MYKLTNNISKPGQAGALVSPFSKQLALREIILAKIIFKKIKLNNLKNSFIVIKNLI